MTAMHDFETVPFLATRLDTTLNAVKRKGRKEYCCSTESFIEPW
jgi:hypothetical protein